MSVAGDHAALGLTFLLKCDIIRGDRRFLWRG